MKVDKQLLLAKFLFSSTFEKNIWQDYTRFLKAQHQTVLQDFKKNL